MSSQRTSASTVRNSARFVVTELLKEPVKSAVREAIREETSTVKTAEETGHERHESDKSQSDKSDSGGGTSVGTWLLALAAIGGVAYLARRRMSSSSGSAWSEPSPAAVSADDAQDGYDTEGEMQTTESRDESDGQSSSASTSTDQ